MGHNPYMLSITREEQSSPVELKFAGVLPEPTYSLMPLRMPIGSSIAKHATALFAIPLCRLGSFLQT